jgi:hypothetical protein
MTNVILERLNALERKSPRAAAGERVPAQRLGVSCAGGVRPPARNMIAFIDSDREAHGVESICRLRPITSST